MNLKLEGNAVTFWLRVKPRSTREGLGLDRAGELRLQLHAAPTGGEANQACVRYLTRALGLPLSSVVIAAGAKSRRKLIRIATHDPKEISDRLRLLTGGAPMPGSPKVSPAPSAGGAPPGEGPA